MSEDEKDLLRSHGIEPRRVPVNKGDVILWRSDVAHCGAPPLGRCDTYRLVAYVCCLPAAITPEAVYRQKAAAYERLETGSHWPSREEWFKQANRHNRIAWQPYLPADVSRRPALTRRQRQLYGLERYCGPKGLAVPDMVSVKGKGHSKGSGYGDAAAVLHDNCSDKEVDGQPCMLPGIAEAPTPPRAEAAASSQMDELVVQGNENASVKAATVAPTDAPRSRRWQRKQ
jgi:hypothetical protein